MNRSFLAALAAGTTLALAACNSTSSSTLPSSPGGASAQVRIVHGSPDAGNVDLGVDSSVVLSNVSYGSVSTYLGIPAGAHTLYVYATGNDQTSAALLTAQVNLAAGSVYSVVASGEVSPKTGSKNLSLTTFTDTPFATASGNAAVNFHDASPAASTLATTVPFGFSMLSSPSDQPLATGTFGTETGPISVPPSAVNTGITLYAITANSGGITDLPSSIDPNDKNNVLATTGADQNLSLYLIDGPGASVTPSASATGIDTARFVGAFDTNGL